MLLLPIELGEFFERDPVQHKHRNLSVALLIVFLIHLLLLFYLQVDMTRLLLDQTEFSSTLEIELVPFSKPEEVFEKPDTVMPLPEPVSVALRDMVPREMSMVTPNQTQIDVQPEVTEVNLSPQGTGMSSIDLYVSSMAFIRSQPLPDRNKFKTFSTADFPGKPQAGNIYQRPAKIGVLISRARTLQFVDNQGYVTLKTNDGFGNIRCLQQRPSPGDAEPMWYLVPAATCGHIK